MALATVQLTGKAGVTTYPLNGLTYSSPSELSATVDGAAATITVDGFRGSFTISSPAVTAGAVIRLTRTTTKTQAALPVSYAGLTHLRASDLDTTMLHLHRIAEEAIDTLDDNASTEGGGIRKESGGARWNGESKKITNAAAGVTPDQSILVSQLSTITEQRLLPAVTAGDNDSGLFVEPDDWATRTPAQSRVHLGLGTAALLAAGSVAANEIAQFDGSARYPAADGRNIDLANHPLTLSLATKERVDRWWGINSSREGTSAALSQTASSTWYEDANHKRSWNGARKVVKGVTDGTGQDIDASFTGGTTARVEINLTGTFLVDFIGIYERSVSGSPPIPFGVRITDNVDSSSQTTYFSYESDRLQAISNNDRFMVKGQFIVKGVDPILVVRAAQLTTGGPFFVAISESLSIQRISTSTS